MPVSIGSPFSNCRNASNPPADAPMPATGNFATVSLLSCVRAGVALTAPRFGTTRSVLGDFKLSRESGVRFRLSYALTFYNPFPPCSQAVCTGDFCVSIYGVIALARGCREQRTHSVSRSNSVYTNLAVRPCARTARNPVRGENRRSPWPTRWKSRAQRGKSYRRGPAATYRQGPLSKASR